MTLEAPEADGAPPTKFGGVVARLAGANGLLVIVALVTGPLLARMLGPDGRGELSAVITVFVLAPLVLDFGLGDFVTRERARGASPGKVVGTAVPMALCFSLVGVALALPVAELIGQDRPVVEQFVRISLLGAPVLVFGVMLLAVARGEQCWSILYRWRLINAVGGGGLIVGLALLGLLTVQTAILATMASSLAALAPSLAVIQSTGRWDFDPALVISALVFGARSWIIALSTAANYRLDQIVMAAVVPSAELGQYAVAVSLTAITFGLVGAVNTALLPRVAQEGAHAVPRIVRVSVLILLVSVGGLAASAPVVVPLVFGDDFQPAVVLVEVLSLGALFFGISWVLGGALQGYGRPQDVVRPQVMGLAITIVGLAIVLKPLGALGAALVTVIAYATVLIGTLSASVRAFNASPRSLLVPRREDLRWFVTIIRRKVK